jgi:hypothetical protein
MILLFVPSEQVLSRTLYVIVQACFSSPYTSVPFLFSFTPCSFSSPLSLSQTLLPTPFSPLTLLLPNLLLNLLCNISAYPSSAPLSTFPPPLHPSAYPSSSLSISLSPHPSLHLSLPFHYPLSLSFLFSLSLPLPPSLPDAAGGSAGHGVIFPLGSMFSDKTREKLPRPRS